MKNTVLISLLTMIISGSLAASEQVPQQEYTAEWASLDSRPNPSWFSEAKFGIFIHWGVYSVPSWGPRGQYAEWYWERVTRDGADGPWRTHHREMYGEDFDYRDFAPKFGAELFDADHWANIFKRSGARYVVLTSKHHDGYALWPAPKTEGWNSVDVGPGRDLCGELSNAVRNAGLHMGFYYSLHDWFHPDYAPGDPNGARDIDKYVEEYMLPQMKDLVLRYEPDIIWPDGEWTAPAEKWRSKEFLAWLFNESPVRDRVAVNDRWGVGLRSSHGGFFTTEYGEVGAGIELGRGRDWEECRGMGHSFGYNRNETIDDYMTVAECIKLLVDTVSRGGNLLLNIGPTADGRIPVIMEDRLIRMGEWLRINGDAIYGTHAWRVNSEQGFVYYTAKGDKLFAICTNLPDGKLVLESVEPTDDTTVRLLGSDLLLEWENDGGRLKLDLAQICPSQLAGKIAFAFEIIGVL